MKFGYKSYCWSLGTTSFRTKNFNKNIELQLKLLDRFWKIENIRDAQWNPQIQELYYDYLRENEFLTGTASNKAKDAREKTSGLYELGLITKDRKLTQAGQALLEISVSGDFTPDNDLLIPRDSFLYLKQLLKTTMCKDDNVVRPFIVLIYFITKFDYLTFEEFTYLLPLVIGEEELRIVEDGIYKLRANKATVDDILLSVLMSKPNYQQALNYFIDNDITEDLICSVGMNRKSSNYDKSYYPFYQNLFDVFIRHDSSKIFDLYNSLYKLQTRHLWGSLIFNTNSKASIKKDPEKSIKASILKNINNEREFKEAFFKYLHLFKARLLLKDYFDLNRRYVRTSDVILFEENRVTLDVIPRYYFNDSIVGLSADMFHPCDKHIENCEIDDISSSLRINESLIISSINRDFKENITKLSQASSLLNKLKYERLNRLIEERFTDQELLELLNHFEKRNDDIIQAMVTDNADIPTIFEYVLGILWYKVSECQGDLFDYMKLSLDANLLPKSHAVGGEADIVYEYSETPYYPEHTLLLEATLATNNQGRMEMEPVSRHLGNHILRTENKNSYCIFSSTYLDINIISDFRNRKTYQFYNVKNKDESVKGMKIIPLKTSDLKNIVRSELKYKDLYRIFDSAYQSELEPLVWYKEEVVDKLYNFLDE